MHRNKVLLGMGVGFAAGVALFSRRRADRIEIRRNLPAPPEAVTALIGQVEREPRFIPGVLSVTVLERGPGWARYRVDLIGGAWVRYRKTWENHRVAWASEAGALGVRQTGLMRLAEDGGGARIHMTVETAFDLPAIGPLAAAASHPFAAFAFRAWLENLGRALA